MCAVKEYVRNGSENVTRNGILATAQLLVARELKFQNQIVLLHWLIELFG